MQDEVLVQAYRTLAPAIYSRCLSLLRDEEEALDAVQDVFVKVQRRLASFRGDSELFTWVYRIATNHCLNVLRARAARGRALERVSRSATDVGVDPADHHERRDLLVQLLRRFEPRLVQIVVHHHLDGMTQAEVGALLGISERAVRKALSRFEQAATHELRSLTSSSGGGP